MSGQNKTKSSIFIGTERQENVAKISDSEKGGFSFISVIRCPC